MTRFTPPTKRYRGYIFDCDGTLADTMPIHHQAWRSALRASGAAFDFSWALFNQRAGMTLERTVEELSEQFSIPLDPILIAAEQRRVFLALEQAVKPIQEVLAFAEGLKNVAPLAVASGSRRPSVERTLTHIGARELFPVIVTPEDVTFGKPAPDMFLLAAERMGIAPEECLVLEDAEFGFEAARRAGMDYVAVLAPDPGS